MPRSSTAAPTKHTNEGHVCLQRQLFFVLLGRSSSTIHRSPRLYLVIGLLRSSLHGHSTHRPELRDPDASAHETPKTSQQAGQTQVSRPCSHGTHPAHRFSSSSSRNSFSSWSCSTQSSTWSACTSDKHTNTSDTHPPRGSESGCYAPLGSYKHDSPLPTGYSTPWASVKWRELQTGDGNAPPRP